MKHKMIGCSEYCLKSACCDSCMFSRRDFLIMDSGEIYKSGPVGCGLYKDMTHQYTAINDGCCPDFHCFRADEDNMIVKEIDDDEMA